MKLLYSEWLKTKRTVIRWILFFLPLCISYCIIAYTAYRKDLSADFIYEAFFTLWTSVFLPLGIGLLTGLFIHEEENAGNFNALLLTGIRREKLYLGKFFFSVLSLTVCTFLTTLIICIGVNFVLPGGMDTASFFNASLLALCGSLPVIAIHVWISFRWGLGASTGVSICGILMAVLMGTTSLGDKIWYFIPWTYPVKMSMFPMAASFLSGTVLYDTVILFLTAFVLSIVLGILFLAGGIFWFLRWDGRSSGE